MPSMLGDGNAASIEMLVAALRPFAAKGASFVRYQTPASGKLHGALLDKDKLVAHTELMQAIVSLKWPRLNANVMDCACIKLFDEFHGIWQLNDEQKGSWVKTVSLRCRTMVSLLMHQMKKNKKKWPEWVLDMGLEPPAATKRPAGLLAASFERASKKLHVEVDDDEEKLSEKAAEESEEEDENNP